MEEEEGNGGSKIRKQTKKLKIKITHTQSHTHTQSQAEGGKIDRTDHLKHKNALYIMRLLHSILTVTVTLLAG